MERNALTLVSLLERLYQVYGSTFEQDITLIGPSMGSEVAQYALAYMEHNNIPHHVKTYISFDGPQQGANVPIGLQNFVEYLTNRGLLSKLTKVKSLVRNGLYNGLAARQLLAHHVSANTAFPAPDALRTKFLSNLQAVGEYPVLCRKVALINGLSDGTKNPHHLTNNESLLHIINKRRGWKSLWGGCNWNVCKNLDWEAKAAPSTGTAKISDMWTLNAIINLIFWVPPFETSKSASAAWGNSSLDNAPGSTFGPLFGTEPDNVNEGKIKFLAKELFYLLTGSKRTTFTQNLNNFSFVPSYSAADLRFPAMTNNSSKNLYMNWSQTNLCGHTPFDYVYAPTDINQQHVAVSQQGSEWFEAEAKCANSDLPVLFNPEINGDANLCMSGNYSVSFCQTANHNITWTVSNPALVKITGIGDQITLTRNLNGVLILTATITYPCAINGGQISNVISKTIIVGKPIVSGTYTDHNGQHPMQYWDGTSSSYNSVCNLYDAQTNMSIQNAVSASWSRISANPTILSWNQSGNDVHFYFWQPNQTSVFKIDASNSCGTTTNTFGFKSIDCSGGGGGCLQFAISPNPSQGILQIVVPNIPAPCDVAISSIGNNKMIQQKHVITQINIYDNLGNLKKSIPVKKVKQATVNLSGLTPGIYFVEIKDGAYSERQKVVLQ